MDKSSKIRVVMKGDQYKIALGAIEKALNEWISVDVENPTDRDELVNEAMMALYRAEQAVARAAVEELLDDILADIEAGEIL